MKRPEVTELMKSRRRDGPGSHGMLLLGWATDEAEGGGTRWVGRGASRARFAWVGCGVGDVAAEAFLIFSLGRSDCVQRGLGSARRTDGTAHGSTAWGHSHGSGSASRRRAHTLLRMED